MRKTNLERPFHPIYNYALITDSEEGLILVDVNTLADGEPRNNNLQRALTWNANGVLNGARHIILGGYMAYIMTDDGLVILSLDDPMQPEVVQKVALNNGHSSFLQFRYLFVTDADGLKVIDVTNPQNASLVAGSTVALDDAKRVFVSRTYAYVAAGAQGLVIVDVERPEAMKVHKVFTDGIVDASDVIVASTNASLFAYVADGSGGLKVVQLTSPDLQPKFYGFSPEPNPALIASYPTDKPARSLSRPLERDRGVDETGGQIAVFGRKGSGPLTPSEMRQLYMDKNGNPWFVKEDAPAQTSQAQEAVNSDQTNEAESTSVASPAGGQD
jgi:hypothetical protein